MRRCASPAPGSKVIGPSGSDTSGPFRDLATDARFAKYQQIDVDLRRPKTDRRRESWAPVAGSIRLGARLGTDHAWAERRDLVSKLYGANMCDLIEANRSGSGPGRQSLAVVRPLDTPELVISERDADQIAKWRRRAKGAKNRISLFDGPDISKPDFEVVLWRFRYRFRCGKPGCNTHTQTIVDWEVAALWRRVRHRPDWQELMRAKVEQEMWQGNDTVLFVGKQERYPSSFLVLGIFWPPDTGYQPRLSL